MKQIVIKLKVILYGALLGFSGGILGLGLSQVVDSAPIHFNLVWLSTVLGVLALMKEHLQGNFDI